MENPNTFIKPSKIHGLGLFAKVDISSGEEIIPGSPDFTFQDEWIVYNRSHKIKSFALAHGYCMINHSKTPNAMRGQSMEFIIANIDIKVGEEITEDYYALPDNQNPFIGINLEKKVFDAKNQQWEEK